MAGINLSEVKAVKPKKEEKGDLQSLLQKDIFVFGKGWPDKKKEAFYLELHILLSAGVDVKSALEIIEDEFTSKKDQELVTKVKEGLISGKNLSEALNSCTGFTDYEIFSLQIGEETGKLPDILKELAYFFKNKIKQKRQAMSALLYPCMVLVTCFGVLAFMLNVIVPMFSDVFLRFGGELPYLTRVVINLSDRFSDAFYPMLAVFAGTGIFISTQKKQVWFRKFYGRFLLKVPVVGELIRKIYLARFCRIMHLLVASRIPLLRGLSLVKKMISFYPIEETMDTIEKDIVQGMPLHKSMSAFNVYHKRMVSLIKVGEEINMLDEFFGKISEQYSDDIEHQSKVLSTLIEPFIIVFLGLVVGIILVAMYLPMFQISTVF